ncbi:hypothetical protein SAMN05660350_04208 [Geodermatophilus obscurus]|uniref:Uncharacterized protein n=1 Tax=Geodermatophilus obscurus TaxID=1861 RepID=A0A1M7UXM7_9ACTN|nr:hypothetical protein [Geodermatophilus obscurus]SHN87680.1 hypothetical protein SAMN05660350_04208 [Geodermatophilus obscurus]
MRDRKDSMAALSSQSPIDPMEGTGPDCWARVLNTREPSCPP